MCVWQVDGHLVVVVVVRACVRMCVWQVDGHLAVVVVVCVAGCVFLGVWQDAAGCVF